MSNPLKIILIVIAAIVVLGAGIIAMGFFWAYSARSVPVKAVDRLLLMGPNELAPYFEDFHPDETAIQIEKKRYFDGTVELTLEYEPEAEDHPMIVVTITRDPKMSDTKTTYLMEWNATRMGLNIGDSAFDVREAGKGFAFGDQSRFGFIEFDAKPVGNMLVIRKGKCVLSLLLMGFYIEDPAIWKELLVERVERLEAFGAR